MIRPATPADAAALAALHQAAFPPDQAWGPQAIGLLLDMPGAFGLWQPDAGLVLARRAADEAEILTIAVVPARRRGGLGRALLLAALAAGAAVGARAMFLEVAETNVPARALYAALGFAEVGRRARYYAGGGDALVLRAVLRAAEPLPALPAA